MSNLPDAADDPRDVAATRYDAAFIQSVDDQIQGLSRDVVPRRNAPYTVAWPKADPDAAALQAGVGVALKATGSEEIVVLATYANLSAGAIWFGVLTATTAPGQRGPVAVAGALPSSITGLSSAGYVRVNALTGALEIVDTPTYGDYGADVIVGTSRADGVMVLSTSGGGATAQTQQVIEMADTDQEVVVTGDVILVTSTPDLSADRVLTLVLGTKRHVVLTNGTFGMAGQLHVTPGPTGNIVTLHPAVDWECVYKSVSPSASGWTCRQMGTAAAGA